MTKRYTFGAKAHESWATQLTLDEPYKGPLVRYVIAAPDGELVDWQVRCVEHLTEAGAHALGIIVAGRNARRPLSTFWSLAVALAQPRSLKPARDPGTARDLRHLGPTDTIDAEPIDFVLDFCDDGRAISHARAIVEKARLGCWRFAFAPSPAGAPP